MKGKKTIRSLVAEAERLEGEAVKLLPLEYPHGTRVHWRHGDAILSGDVVGHHPYIVELKVLGRTGKEYYLPECRIVSKDLP